MEEKQKQKEDEELIATSKHQMLLCIVHEQARKVGDSKTLQATNDMTYDGPLPSQKPDGSWTNIYSSILDYNIAGINFRSASSIKRCVGDFMVRLVPEPNNDFDPNAVKIIHEGNIHIGYIPAAATAHLRAHVQLPAYGWGHIEEREEYEADGSIRTFYTGTVWVETAPTFQPSDQTETN